MLLQVLAPFSCVFCLQLSAVLNVTVPQYSLSTFVRTVTVVERVLASATLLSVLIVYLFTFVSPDNSGAHSIILFTCLVAACAQLHGTCWCCLLCEHLPCCFCEHHPCKSNALFVDLAPHFCTQLQEICCFLLEMRGFVAAYVSRTTGLFEEQAALVCLCFSRQTSWDNDDFSHWREIKKRREDSSGLLKKNSVKHQKSSTGITLHLVFLTSFGLCQAITGRGEGRHIPRTDLHSFYNQPPSSSALQQCQAR